MLKRAITLLFIVFLLVACTKKKAPPPTTPSPPKTPTVKFIFVNRIGFRNDSTRHGVNDTVFQGPCFNIQYYNKEANQSYLAGACYNRNFPANNYPLKDSILVDEFEVNPGCKYTYEIEMVWKRPIQPFTTKDLKYNLKIYPGSDTLKFARDTVIKFIWPNDTANGKFVKTFQYP